MSTRWNVLRLWKKPGRLIRLLAIAAIYTGMPGSNRAAWADDAAAPVSGTQASAPATLPAGEAGKPSAEVHPVAIIAGLTVPELICAQQLWPSELMRTVVQTHEEKFKALPQALQDQLVTHWDTIVHIYVIDPKESGTVLINLSGIDDIQQRHQVSDVLVHVYLRQIRDARVAAAHEKADVLNALRARAQANLQQIEADVKDAMTHLTSRGSAIDAPYRDAWVHANLEVAQLKARLAVQQQVIDQNLPNLRVGNLVPAALTAILGQTVIQPKDENERSVIQFSLAAAMEKLRIEIAVGERNADDSAKRYDSAKIDAADITLETRALNQRLADEDSVENLIRTINSQLSQLDDQSAVLGVTANRLE